MSDVAGASAHQPRAVRRADLDALVSVNPIPTVVVGLAGGHFLALNEAFRRAAGLAPGDTGGPAVALSPRQFWADPEQRRAVFDALAEHGRVDSVEVTFRAIGGAPVPFLLGASLLTVDGEPAALMVAHDLSDIRRASALDARLASIVHSSRDPILTIDASGLVTSWNPAAEALFQFTGAELVGRPYGPLVPADERAECDGMLRRVRAGERIVEHEAVRLRKDGTRVDVAVSLSLIVDTPTTRGEVCAIVRDISVRKREQEQIARYADVVARMPVGLSVWQPVGGDDPTDFRLVAMNRAAARMTGIEAALKIGKSWRQVFPLLTRPEYAANWVSALRSPKPNPPREGTFELPDGSRRQFLTSMFPLPGDAVGMLIQDVTALRQLENQVRQAQKVEAVGLLAGGIAHDFNNLLGVILGYGDVLRGQLPAGENRQMLDQIVGAAERAAGLTRQLLAYSRNQVLEARTLDLNAVVAGAEELLRRLIGEDVAVRTVLAPKLGTVYADPGQIEQILMNLAVNARDAMPRGGTLTIATESVHVSRRLEQADGDVKPGDYVVLRVSDTGHGIDEQARSRLFEPFYTTKPPGSGTGLGLAVVHGIVKQSGGHIFVASQPEQGAEFTIFLPRVDREAGAPRPVEERRVVGGTETIMVVEDDATLRALAQAVLEQHGYSVLVAAGGAEALDRCEQFDGDIHLLLTDVVMPGIGGRELAERVQQLRPRTKCLFMSGYTDDRVVRYGVLHAKMAFLQKPFTPSVLLARVRELLDGP